MRFWPLDNIWMKPYIAWQLFKEMLQKRPHHGLQKWEQVQTFYQWLDYHNKLTWIMLRVVDLMGRLQMKHLISSSTALRDHQIILEKSKHILRVSKTEGKDVAASLTSKMDVWILKWLVRIMYTKCIITFVVSSHYYLLLLWRRK